MTKMCCIAKCESKSSDTGAKKRSLFGFPKDVHVNKMWMDIVSSFLDEIRATNKCLYICDKHFKYSDVERTYRTVLKNGRVHEMPRDRFQLKANAVPYFADENENDLQKEFMDIEDETVEASPTEDLQNPEPFSNDIDSETDLKDDKISICRGLDNQTPCPHGSVRLPLKSRRQRCDFCRVQRRLTMENERRKAKRYSIKQQKMKQLIKHLKQQNKRLKTLIAK